MMDGRSDGRTDGRTTALLACLGIAWSPFCFSIHYPDWGLSWHDALWLPKKRIFKCTQKKNKQKINTNNITNKQTNLKDFANWKGGAGKDPNAPGKTPMRQETVQNPSDRLQAKKPKDHVYLPFFRVVVG